MYPSYLGLGVSGTLIFLVVVVLIYNMFSQNGITRMDLGIYNSLVLLTLLSIAVGIHSLGHAYSEVNFGFNPLEGKWNYSLRN